MLSFLAALQEQLRTGACMETDKTRVCIINETKRTIESNQRYIQLLLETIGKSQQNLDMNLVDGQVNDWRPI